MINKTAVLAGAVGGIAPNFLRLIVNYSSPLPQPMLGAPIGYCLAIAGFAVLGAVVVSIFQETDLKRAFFVGIGLPSLLQVGTLQLAQSPNPQALAPPSAGAQASISLVSSAYAQEGPSQGPSAAGRKLNLTTATSAPQYAVSFFGSDNKWLSTKPGGGAVDIPPTAAKFVIQVGGSSSPSYALPATPNAVINARVKIDEKAASGFLQGIGLAKAGQYEITVQIQ